MPISSWIVGYNTDTLSCTLIPVFSWSVFSRYYFSVANIFPIWTDGLTLTFRAPLPVLGEDQAQAQGDKIRQISYWWAGQLCSSVQSLFFSETCLLWNNVSKQAGAASFNLIPFCDRRGRGGVCRGFSPQTFPRLLLPEQPLFSPRQFLPNTDRQQVGSQQEFFAGETRADADNNLERWLSIKMFWCLPATPPCWAGPWSSPRLSPWTDG